MTSKNNKEKSVEEMLRDQLRQSRQETDIAIIIAVVSWILISGYLWKVL